MKTIDLPVLNSEGMEIDVVKVDADVLDDRVNTAVIHQVVTAFRAGQRMGLAATKTRGEVSGGGRKPWKQKGTGRARAGSTRSPLWSRGGVVFGPHPRDFSYPVPKKVKQVGLKAALLVKIKENNLIVLDGLKITEPKTKAAAKLFTDLKVDTSKSVLLLSDALDKNARLALRNLEFLDISLAKDTHAYEIMAHRKVLITRAGLAVIVERLKK